MTLQDTMFIGLDVKETLFLIIFSPFPHRAKTFGVAVCVIIASESLTVHGCDEEPENELKAREMIVDMEECYLTIKHFRHNIMTIGKIQLT